MYRVSSINLHSHTYEVHSRVSDAPHDLSGNVDKLPLSRLLNTRQLVR